MKLNNQTLSDPDFLTGHRQASTPAQAEATPITREAMACIGQRKKKNGELLGWRVHIARRGIRVDRNFTVFAHGTSDKALAAAMIFRDEVFQKVSLLSLAEYCAIIKSHNTSGIPGVRRTKEGMWRMRIHLPEGREVSRHFSVSRYGEQGAFERAVKARAEALSLVQNYSVRHGGYKVSGLEKPMSSAAGCELARRTYAEAPDPNPYHKGRLGVPGVVHSRQTYVKTSGETTVKDYKVARYKPRGQKQKTRYFSVQKHGEEEALRLAVDQYQIWLREAMGSRQGGPLHDEGPPSAAAAAAHRCP